jgi:prolipoprotein diacylglyceryltransferase
MSLKRVKEVTVFIYDNFINIVIREVTDCEATISFPAFYGTRRFITEFTRALHLYLS